MPERWHRHDLLRVKPEAWSRVLADRPPLATLPHVARWAARGWPLVVRRRAGSDQPDMVPAGLPLPPACGKLRVAVELPRDGIHARVPPQTLRLARGMVPPTWRPAVDALLGVADRTGVEPRVFGSLLWQGLTGLPYLSQTSDLDLLWPVADLGAALDLVPRLAAVEVTGAARFDGEILLPDGGAVQWRELLAGSTEVLVKTDHGVQLRPLEGLCPPGLSIAA